MEKVQFDVKVYGNFIEIIPKTLIQDNSLYSIKLDGVKSIDGKYELENTTLNVYTAVTPAYATIDAVNSIVEACGISDKDILLKIRDASRTADFIMAGINGPTYVNNTDIMIPRIKEQASTGVSKVETTISKAPRLVQEDILLEAGNTIITLNNGYYSPGTGSVELSVDGVTQPSIAYLETSPKEIRLKAPIDEDVIITVIYNDEGGYEGTELRYDVPFEVSEYVKYKAAKEAILKFYVGKAAVAGEKGTLADISFEHQPKMPDIKELLDELTIQIKFWQDAIRGYGVEGRAKPKATLQGRNAIPLSVGTVNSLSPVYQGYDRGV